eukprot:4686243-Amphidinium_carterae.1
MEKLGLPFQGFLGPRICRCRLLTTLAFAIEERCSIFAMGTKLAAGAGGKSRGAVVANVIWKRSG